MTNTKYIKLLEETFETGIRDKYFELWDYMDYIIDEGAKCDGMDCSGEWYYPSIEDFCKYYNILEIPPLYIFGGRGSPFCLSKAVAYMKTEWNERFPDKLQKYKNNHNIEFIKEYRTYLEDMRANDETYYNYCLEHLEDYLGLIEDSDSNSELK
jgi:hypothetical protein